MYNNGNFVNFCNDFRNNGVLNSRKEGKMEEIYKKYSRLVYNYLYRLTNDIEVSEELTQETFYSAIKGIKNFKEQSTIRVWLCQIAKNKWKDYLKKSKKLKFISFNDEIEALFTENDIEENIVSREEKIEFYQKIHLLDVNTKEVIYLKIKEDFTFKEIGKILDRSEEWARVTFYRGKIKLKEGFKNEQRM